MTVKDLGLGRIIWFGSLIVGITGATLEEEENGYDDEEDGEAW